MTTDKAQRIIFGLMALIVTLTIISDVNSGTSKVYDAVPRRLLAGSIASIGLMLLAVVIPKSAVALTGITTVSVFVVSPTGESIIQAIGQITGTTYLSGETAARLNEVANQPQPI